MPHRLPTSTVVTPTLHGGRNNSASKRFTMATTTLVNWLNERTSSSCTELESETLCSKLVYEDSCVDNMYLPPWKKRTPRASYRIFKDVFDKVRPEAYLRYHRPAPLAYVSLPNASVRPQVSIIIPRPKLAVRSVNLRHPYTYISSWG